MADKRFNLVFDVDANIAPVKNAVNNLQGVLSKINIPDGFKKNLESTFSKLSSEIENFEAIANKGFANMADVSKAEKSFGKITDLLSKLRLQTGQIKGIDPEKLLPQENLKKIKELQQSWAKLKTTIEKGTGNSNEINKQTQELANQEKELKKLETSYNSLAAANKTMGQTKGSLSQSLAADRKEADALVAKMSQLEKVKGGKSTAEYKTMAADLKALYNTIERNQKQYDLLDATINKNRASMASFSTQIKATQGNIDNIKDVLKSLQDSAQRAPEGLKELITQLAKIKGVDISEIPTDIDQIGQEIDALNAEQVKQLADLLNVVETNAEGIEEPLRNGADAMADLVNKGTGLNQRAQEMEQLANRVKQFFSIGNTVQLFKRSINSAFNTIKELDAVMTQTAVVTDFTVGDMWAQLPEYTKRANELGVSVKGAYEAATLYYQQGLDTNEVIGVSNETLKMAKIAAIDYATATDYMTSALRGFNMEVNEESARNINDIYSQLAAKTAADTEEISIAMSKTAPLAHNAGMEIETTAALLSQMIETTREAPETLGTAMKTVIARFQELKKDPALIEPVEGEIIDANKIEGALRTIGVSLRDANGQFRDLDNVFLEISQKWDSLSTNTQRYIATIAAGSRQQSRFIAMMANYSRTTELVAMANNAAGASQEQFEKTLESMQSKLDRLHNAWNEYTMGLANNQIIKTVIDLLTGFLNTINKISTSLSGDKGILKGLFDVTFLIAGLKLAKAAFNGFFGWLINTGEKTSKQFINDFSQNLQKVSLKTRSWSKEINNHLKQALQQKGNINFDDLINEFKKVPQEIQKEISQKSPEIGRTLEQEFKASIDYEQLNDIGKKIADGITQDFITEFNDGDIDQALVRATQNLKNTNFEQFGGKNFDTTAKLSKNAINDLTKSFSALGNGVGAAGSLLNNFASILDGLGLGAAANAVRGLGNALSSVGGIISSVGAIMIATGIEVKAEWWEIALVIAGIAAVIGLVAFAISKAKANSLEGQMKAVEESTKRAKEAAEEAKNAYDQLLNDKSGYDETQQALKDLTYGTQEWKEALIEANQQVLSLLQTYPELMKYLGKGEYGQLTISGEGWEAAIEAQQKVVTRAQGAVAQSQLQQYRLQEKVLDRDLAKNFQYTEYYEGGSYTTTDVKTQQTVKDLVARDLSDGELDNALRNLANNSRWTKEELEGAARAVIEYNNAIDQNRLEMQNVAKAFLTSSLTTEHMGQVGQDVAENIINAFSNNLIETSEEEIDSFSQEIKSDRGKREKLANELGIILGGTRRNQLNQLYAALSGQTLEEVKAMKLSRDQLAKEIAKYQNSENISETMNNFAESFTNFAEEIQEQVNLAMSEGAGYISGMTEEANLNLKDSEIKAIEAVYGSLKEYAAAYAKAVENGKVEIEEAKQPLKDLSIIDDSFGIGLNASAISGLTSHLMEVFEVSGSAAASTLARAIQTTLEGMNTDQATEFATALNSIDWSSADSIEGLSDRLEQLVKDGAMSEDQVDGLEKQIVELAKAARTVDLETVAEQIKSLSKIQYNIEKDEQGLNFSESDYKTLIDAGVASAGDFVYNLATDSWTYIAGSMEALSEAIGENTTVLLGLDSLESGVRSSEAAVKVREEYRRIDTSSNIELFNAIQSYIQRAGDDNKLVSQDWLTNNANDVDALLAKWKEILGEAYALEERKVQTEQVKTQGQQIQLQSNTTQENAQLAIAGDQNALAALQAQASMAEITKDIYNELTEAIRSKTGEEQAAAIQTLANIAAVYQEAQAWGLDGEKLGFYIEQLQLAYPGMEADAAARIALANTLLNTGLNEVIGSYDDWVSLIDESTGKIKASTSDDIEVFNALKKSIQKMIGTSEDLSDAFWDNAKNIDAIKRAAEGDLEAIEELQKAASKDFVMNIDFGVHTEEAQAAIDKFYNYLESVDLPQLEAGVQWNGNGAAQFIAAFNQMAHTANLTADQIQEAVHRMGYDANITYIEDTRQVPIEHTKRVIDAYDPESGEAIEWHTQSWTEGTEPITGMFPVVETLTSTGSGGGGISVSNKTAGAANAKKAAGGGNKGKSGGGGSSKKEEEPWKNSYDWLYNLTQKINEELRTREKLERRYQRLLKTYSATGAELKEITDQELASLEKRRKLEEQMVELRRKELKEYLAANEALAEYASIDWDLEVVKIDWNKINTVTKKEEGEKIEAYVEKLEKIIDEIKDTEDNLEDIEDSVIEIKNRGKEQYQDLEDRVLSALISEQQELIDKEEETISAISKAESSLVDAISKNIEKMRQDRKNEETETSLAEKERRLAYLRQDTTGSNQLEIMKLEEDLRKERQDYTDSLIDQSLNDLKEQNDQAATQREQQIKLLQSQLDWQEKTGYFVDEATRIVREGIGENGVIDKSSRMYQLLAAQEDLPTMSNASRAQWNEDLANSVSQAFVWLQGLLNQNSTNTTESQDYSRNYAAEMIEAIDRKDYATFANLEQLRNQKIRDQGLQSEWPETHMYEQYQAGKNSKISLEKDYMDELNKAQERGDWRAVFYAAGQRDAKIAMLGNSTYEQDETLAEAFRRWYAQTGGHIGFKTGGLADFTGPAWLDGSKARPEMVLNAQDTKNFIELKDILRGLNSGVVNNNQTGNLYFDINVNVDNIASDYDVENVTKAVKQSIYEEATYRGVNVINLLK